MAPILKGGRRMRPIDKDSGYPASLIEKDDINSLRSLSGTLTSNALFYLINEFRNLKSRVAFVSPNWLDDYMRPSSGTVDPNYIPPFIYNELQGEAPIGLAVPLNLDNNHWVTIYINLEACGAVDFDSLGNCGIPEHVSQRLNNFYEQYETWFGLEGTGVFRIENYSAFAKQDDLVSCGIYTVRNMLDILDGRVPSAELMDKEELEGFRHGAWREMEWMGKWQQERMEGMKLGGPFSLYDDWGKKPNAEKKVTWGDQRPSLQISVG